MTAITVFMMLAGYVLWWSIWYRLPTMPDQLVDLRSNPSQSAAYITFCAGLADNPIGFPGHAYVSWSPTAGADLLKAESVGYISKFYNDQFVSPVVPVPGMLHFDAARYNQRNLEKLTVVVDQDTYQKTIAARSNWNTGQFKALDRDCLSFCTAMAKSAGLKVPDQRCMFPQDQIKQLKILNQARNIAR